MTVLPDIFVTDAGGVIRFKGHRIRLIDVAARFEEGLSPEAILTEWYPTLSLAQVYRAVAYHLENEDEVRGLLEANREALREMERHAKLAPTVAELRQRLLTRKRPEAS